MNNLSFLDLLKLQLQILTLFKLWGEGWRGGFLLNISFSGVKIRLHTEYQIHMLPESDLTFVVWHRLSW